MRCETAPDFNGNGRQRKTAISSGFPVSSAQQRLQQGMSLADLDLQVRWESRASIHRLCRGAKIIITRQKYVFDECLWVAIEQRKPRALHLNHDSVAPSESVLALVHIYRVGLDLSRRNRTRGSESLAVAAA